MLLLRTRCLPGPCLWSHCLHSLLLKTAFPRLVGDNSALWRSLVHSSAWRRGTRDLSPQQSPPAFPQQNIRLVLTFAPLPPAAHSTLPHRPLNFLPLSPTSASNAPCPYGLPRLNGCLRSPAQSRFSGFSFKHDLKKYIDS